MLKDNILWRAGIASFYLFNDTAIEASGNVFGDGAQFPAGVQPDALKENAGWSRVGAFREPDRNITGYQQQLGYPGGLDGFLAKASRQARTDWNPDYTAQAVNNWLRGGFGM